MFQRLQVGGLVPGASILLRLSHQIFVLEERGTKLLRALPDGPGQDPVEERVKRLILEIKAEFQRQN